MRVNSRILASVIVSMVLCQISSAQQSPTFSVDYQGPPIAGPDSLTGSPITEGDLLVPQPLFFPIPGPLLLPGILIFGGLPSPGPDLGLPAYGAPPAPGIPGFVEVDALSYGLEKPLDPFVPILPVYLFSVDEWATGALAALPAPSVFSEGAADPLCIASACEASADVFSNFPPGLLIPQPLPPFSAPPGHIAAYDGDGLLPWGGLGFGLIEPNPPAPGIPPAIGELGTNLDALDIDTGMAPIFPVYFSLDSGLAVFDFLEGIPNTGSAAANFGAVASGADVYVTPVPGGPPIVFAPGPALGLDLAGVDTDDLDALILFENGTGVYEPSMVPYDWLVPGVSDMLLFSVRRGSAIIGTFDSIFGFPIEEGDILTTPCVAGAAYPPPAVGPAFGFCVGGPGGVPTPGIWIPADTLGLDTLRAGALFADDLNALDLDPDCNASGVADAVDIALGFSLDCNGNAEPDECEGIVNDWCKDADGDGFGDPGTLISTCTPPAGFVLDCSDCDDLANSVNPAAPEILCDGIDQNCNGLADDDKNDDGDPVSFCSGDCDDLDPLRFPGNPEVTCNGIDDDCVAATLDDPDGDGDGFGICTDCNDLNSTIFPGAPEILCDGIDQNCNGLADDDKNDDGDPVSFCSGDCDDLDPLRFPGNPEVTCNGIDDDCSSATQDDPDSDGDGVGVCTDCDDADPARFPGNPEVTCNGIDDDCAAATPDDPNVDGDPVSLCNGDCDDADPTRFPGNTETCTGGVDEDCDFLIDCADVADCAAAPACTAPAPPVLAASPHDLPKQKYISIDASTNGATLLAIKIEETISGKAKWASLPNNGLNVSSRSVLCDNPLVCSAGDPTLPPVDCACTGLAAGDSCGNFGGTCGLLDWSSYSVLNMTGCIIQPFGVIEITFVADPLGAAVSSAVLGASSTCAWGDVQVIPGPCNVGIGDIVEGINIVTGGGAFPNTHADIQGNIANGELDIGDIVAVINSATAPAFATPVGYMVIASCP